MRTASTFAHATFDKAESQSQKQKLKQTGFVAKKRETEPSHDEGGSSTEQTATDPAIHLTNRGAPVTPFFY
jgi:hypothetical protein